MGLVKTWILSVSLFIGISGAAGAKTVTFPEKDPAFSVTLPAGWTAELDPLGNLSCKAGGGSWLKFSIGKLFAKNDEEMKAYLQGITKPSNTAITSPDRIRREIDIKTFDVSEIKETTTPNHLKLFRITWSSRFREILMFHSTTAFSPEKGSWFAVDYSEWEQEVNPVENWGVVSKILESIRPISERKR
jgi:hypothetical protein